jgi:hypothetical protein
MAILSAGLKGHSRLMGEDEEATIGTLTEYKEILSTFIFSTPFQGGLFKELY